MIETSEKQHTEEERATSVLFSHLPRELILQQIYRGDGDEIASGKFASLESSSALAANAFGFFLQGQVELSLPLSGLQNIPIQEICLEGIVRFPWAGGRHPNLDVLLTTPHELIGIECKRYEPYRKKGKTPPMSDAYWRPVWGQCMAGCEEVRDHLRRDPSYLMALDAAQLVKHAFGLRTQASKTGKKARLIYVFAEPASFPDGRNILETAFVEHRKAVRLFAEAVAGDEVAFQWTTYRDILAHWGRLETPVLTYHVRALREAFPQI